MRMYDEAIFNNKIDARINETLSMRLPIIETKLQDILNNTNVRISDQNTQISNNTNYLHRNNEFVHNLSTRVEKKIRNVLKGCKDLIVFKCLLFYLYLIIFRFK